MALATKKDMRKIVEAAKQKQPLFERHDVTLAVFRNEQAIRDLEALREGDKKIISMGDAKICGIYYVDGKTSQDEPILHTIDMDELKRGIDLSGHSLVIDCEGKDGNIQRLYAHDVQSSFVRTDAFVISTADSLFVNDAADITTGLHKALGERTPLDRFGIVPGDDPLYEMELHDAGDMRYGVINYDFKNESQDENITKEEEWEQMKLPGFDEEPEEEIDIGRS